MPYQTDNICPGTPVVALTEVGSTNNSPIRPRRAVSTETRITAGTRVETGFAELPDSETVSSFLVKAQRISSVQLKLRRIF